MVLNEELYLCVVNIIMVELSKDLRVVDAKLGKKLVCGFHLQNQKF